jgi:hypothetical protein
MPSWKETFDALSCNSMLTEFVSYFEANKQVVTGTLSGAPAHGGGQPRTGLHVVVNLPSRRAISFLMPPSAGTSQGKYQNRYAYARIVGKPLPTSGARDKIDEALAEVSQDSNLGARDGHYAAMEVNGFGVRYFGDICLVLKPETVDADTLTLLRNSYDVRTLPASQSLDGLTGQSWDNEVRQIFKSWMGKWARDGVHIAATKIMTNAPYTNRRMTTAHVSGGVLNDEDYIEVVLSHEFGPSDVEELRVSAEDAAAEALIGDRTRVGHPPSASDALWRYRRRVASKLAQSHNLPARVITTTGRARS